MTPPVGRSIAEAQRVRVDRFLRAALVYAVAVLTAPLMVHFGMGDARAVHWIPFVGLAVLINLAFYLLFRSGLNLRFPDPSLKRSSGRNARSHSTSSCAPKS